MFYFCKKFFIYYITICFVSRYNALLGIRICKGGSKGDKAGEMFKKVRHEILFIAFNTGRRITNNSR
jgi:hypothetical protein